jgi:hypothetical protein
MSSTLIFESFKTRTKVWNRAVAELDAKIARLEEMKRALEQPHWIKDLIKPMGNLLLKDPRMEEFPTYDVLGPFGLSASVSIHFYRKGVPKEKRLETGNRRSITFIPVYEPKSLDFTLKIIDYSRDTGKYKKGTIGAANLMNYVRVDLPETAKELVDFMLREEEQ